MYINVKNAVLITGFFNKRICELSNNLIKYLSKNIQSWIFFLFLFFLLDFIRTMPNFSARKFQRNFAHNSTRSNKYKKLCIINKLAN